MSVVSASKICIQDKYLSYALPTYLQSFCEKVKAECEELTLNVNFGSYDSIEDLSTLSQLRDLRLLIFNFHYFDRNGGKIRLESFESLEEFHCHVNQV